MTDNYQFSKSNSTENIDSYSPFTDKQWNYINDINSGVYQNSGLTLVQWDLSSIYNSSKWSDISECYVTLPITMVANVATDVGANIAPGTAKHSLLSLKSNFVNLIHQGDVQVSGSSIEQIQPFLNVFQNFRMISEMSDNDLKTIGSTIGFSESLDSYGSCVCNGAVQTVPGVPDAKVKGGNGLCNNFPYPAANTPGTDVQLSNGVQNTNVINKAIQQRVNRYYDVTGNTVNNIIGGVKATAATAGNLLSVDNTSNEFRPYYQIVNTHYMVWYDVAVIRLGDIFDSMKQLGMLKRFDGILRLYVNCGAVQIKVTNPNADTTYQYSFSNSSFSNTIPFTINFITAALPATTALITASCSIVRPASTSYTNVNLAASGAVHPMGTKLVRIKLHNKSNKLQNKFKYYAQIM